MYDTEERRRRESTKEKEIREAKKEGLKAIKPFLVFLSFVLVVLISYAIIGKRTDTSGNNLTNQASWFQGFISKITEVFESDREINVPSTRSTKNQYNGDKKQFRECKEDEIKEYFFKKLQEEGLLNPPSDVNINNSYTFNNNIINISGYDPCQPKSGTKYTWIIGGVTILVTLANQSIDLIVKIKKELLNDDKKPELGAKDKTTENPEVTALNKCMDEITSDKNLKDRKRILESKAISINGGCGYKFYWKLDKNDILICFYNKIKNTAKLKTFPL
ncbi:MAG: hypothetical protein V3V31_13735 [Methylococcales bacterium]